MPQTVMAALNHSSLCWTLSSTKAEGKSRLLAPSQHPPDIQIQSLSFKCLGGKQSNPDSLSEGIERFFYHCCFACIQMETSFSLSFSVKVNRSNAAVHNDYQFHQFCSSGLGGGGAAVHTGVRRASTNLSCRGLHLKRKTNSHPPTNWNKVRRTIKKQ